MTTGPANTDANPASPDESLPPLEKIPGSGLQAEELLEPGEAAPTISVFDPQAIEESIGEARRLESGAEILAELGQVYDRELHKSWASFILQTTDSLLSVVAERNARISAVDARAREETAAIESKFEDANRPIELERWRLAAELEKSTAEKNEFVRATWLRVGRGLRLPSPQALDHLAQPGSAPAADAVNYAASRRAAATLAPVGRLRENPILVKWLPGSAGGAVLAAWVASASFTGGLLVAAVVAAGIAAMVFALRRHAAQVYETLVHATAPEHSRCRSNTDLAIRGCDEKSNELFQAKREELAQTQARREKEIAGAEAAYAGTLRICAALWERSLATVRGALQSLDQAVEAIIRANASVMAPLRHAPAPGASLPDRLAVRIGEIEPRYLDTLASEVANLVQTEPTSPARLGHRIPAFWEPAARGTLIYADEAPARERAGNLLAAAIGRILAVLPPGKVNLTLFDPVGLGQNFAGFLKLGDYSKELIGGQAWSNREQMRLRLRDLILHIETVTQKYLRDDYPDLESYHHEAGEIAEPYHFLVIADFPEQFDQEAMRDLERIVENGPRCGVYTLIHAAARGDTRRKINADTLRPFAAEIGVAADAGRSLFRPDATLSSAVPVDLDEAPSAEVLRAIVAHHGEGSRRSGRADVSFDHLCRIAGAKAEDWWHLSAAHGIEAPLGLSGTRSLRTLSLGMGVADHALIAGGPGEGKSNLLHLLVAALCRFYSPEEVQLCVLDFSPGAEFKILAETTPPHARVVVVACERELGLSVLAMLDAGLTDRAAGFRSTCAASLAEYRAATDQVVSRNLLIIEDFEALLSGNDRIHREALRLLERLTDEGDKHGIHLVLATGNLAKAGLPAAIRARFGVRIALRCDVADARLVLGDGSPVARLPGGAGSAVYNDQGGAAAGHSFFQAALFSPQDRRRAMGAVAETTARLGWSGTPPIVIQGDEPPPLERCRCLFEGDAAAPGEPLPMWIGEPIAIKPPVAATIERRAGRNLLVVSKDEEQGVALMMAALLSLAACTAPGSAGFSILNYAAADAPWAVHPKRFAAAFPHPVEVGGKPEVVAMLQRVAAEVARRLHGAAVQDAAGPPTLVVAIIGLQRIRDLRTADAAPGIADKRAEEGNASALLARILRDGPAHGVHVLAWSDSLASVRRALDRASLDEFGLRAAGPLSESDSYELFDSDAAAQLDRPFRMVRADDDRVGVVERFRPYGMPTAELIERIGARPVGAKRRRSKPARKRG